MNLVNVYEPKAVIVIEKFSDNTIKQSSNLFCGACGRICAIVQNDLEFDFRFSDLKKNSNSFFLFENEEGVSCSRCQSHLFDGNSSISFTTLEQFEEFQAGAFGRKMSSKMKDDKQIEGLDNKLTSFESNNKKVEKESGLENVGENIFKKARDKQKSKSVIDTEGLNEVSAKVFRLKKK